MKKILLLLLIAISLEADQLIKDKKGIVLQATGKQKFTLPNRKR